MNDMTRTALSVAQHFKGQAMHSENGLFCTKWTGY
jgi:hypothetical protein